MQTIGYLSGDLCQHSASLPSLFHWQSCTSWALLPNSSDMPKNAQPCPFHLTHPVISFRVPFSGTHLFHSLSAFQTSGDSQLSVALALIPAFLVVELAVGLCGRGGHLCTRCLVTRYEPADLQIPSLPRALHMERVPTFSVSNSSCTNLAEELQRQRLGGYSSVGRVLSASHAWVQLLALWKMNSTGAE